MANFFALIKLLNQLLPLLMEGIRAAQDAALEYKIEKQGEEIKVIFGKVKNDNLNDEDLANEAGNLNDIFR
jgi:hypothetical protein